MLLGVDGHRVALLTAGPSSAVEPVLRDQVRDRGRNDRPRSDSSRAARARSSRDSIGRGVDLESSTRSGRRSTASTASSRSRGNPGRLATPSRSRPRGSRPARASSGSRRTRLRRRGRSHRRSALSPSEPCRPCRRGPPARPRIARARRAEGRQTRLQPGGIASLRPSRRLVGWLARWDDDEPLEPEVVDRRGASARCPLCGGSNAPPRSPTVTRT